MVMASVQGRRVTVNLIEAIVSSSVDWTRVRTCLQTKYTKHGRVAFALCV